jgi:hypothetical protein
MFRVDDVYAEAKQILGVCDEPKLFRWIADAVSLLVNKEDLEGWKGYLDVCTAGCSCAGIGSICNNPSGCGRKYITLPREVDTVLGVNIGGQPVLGYGQLFEFHLNGPGSCRTICEWKWEDAGKFHCTYKDIITPAKLVAFLSTAEDNNSDLIIYGYDSTGQVLRRFENNKWINGLRIPTVYGVALPDEGAPLVARITGVYKSETVGNVRLSTTDDTGPTGILLGIYEPDETLPQYRRIKLNRSCNWVRIAFLKSTPKFASRFDHIPLRSRIALLQAIRAVKAYDDLQTDSAHGFESDAARMELEAQMKAEPPVYNPPQVIDMSNPRDKYDYDIR